VLLNNITFYDFMYIYSSYCWLQFLC